MKDKKYREIPRSGSALMGRLLLELSYVTCQKY